MGVKWKNHGELKIITINIPLEHLKYVQQLMDWGKVPSRSEYVRTAVANQIENDMKTKKYIKKVIKNPEEILEPEKFVRIPGYNGDKPVEIIRRLDY